MPTAVSIVANLEWLDGAPIFVRPVLTQVLNAKLGMEQTEPPSSGRKREHARVADYTWDDLNPDMRAIISKALRDAFDQHAADNAIDQSEYQWRDAEFIWRTMHNPEVMQMRAKLDASTLSPTRESLPQFMESLALDPTSQAYLPNLDFTAETLAQHAQMELKTNSHVLRSMLGIPKDQGQAILDDWEQETVNTYKQFIAERMQELLTKVGPTTREQTIERLAAASPAVQATAKQQGRPFANVNFKDLVSPAVIDELMNGLPEAIDQFIDDRIDNLAQRIAGIPARTGFTQEDASADLKDRAERAKEGVRNVVEAGKDHYRRHFITSFAVNALGALNPDIFTDANYETFNRMMQLAVSDGYKHAPVANLYYAMLEGEKVPELGVLHDTDLASKELLLDDNGKPVILVHSSASAFEEFDTTQMGDPWIFLSNADQQSNLRGWFRSHARSRGIGQVEGYYNYIATKDIYAPLGRPGMDEAELDTQRERILDATPVARLMRFKEEGRDDMSDPEVAKAVRAMHAQLVQLGQGMHAGLEAIGRRLMAGKYADTAENFKAGIFQDSFWANSQDPQLKYNPTNPKLYLSEGMTTGLYEDALLSGEVPAIFKDDTFLDWADRLTGAILRAPGAPDIDAFGPIRGAIVGQKTQMNPYEMGNNWASVESAWLADSIAEAGFKGFSVYEDSFESIAVFSQDDLIPAFRGRPEAGLPGRFLYSLAQSEDLGADEVGLSYNVPAQDPTGEVHSYSKGFVKVGEDRHLSFTARTLSDGSQLTFAPYLPDYTEADVQHLGHGLAYNAALNRASYVLVPDLALAQSVADYGMGEIFQREDGQYEVTLTPAGYQKLGPQLADIANERVNESTALVTGRLDYNPGTWMESLPQAPAANPDAMRGASDYHARMDRYYKQIDRSIRTISRQSQNWEQRVLDTWDQSKGFKGAYVGRMTRAMFLHNDLLNMAIQTGESVEDHIERLRKEAKAKGNAFTQAQEAWIKDSQNLPAPIKALAADIAQANDLVGRALQRQGYIGNRQAVYGARAWFDPKVGTTSTLGLGGVVDPTRAGGRLKLTMGTRRMQRSLDSILEGWSEGLELQANNLIAISERVHRDAAEAVYHTNMLASLEAGGLVARKRKGNKIPSGFVPLGSNSIAAQDIYVHPDLKKDLYNLTNRLDWTTLPLGETLQKLYKLNSKSKSSILFTSLFHHYAFIRSYYFGTPGFWHGVSGITVRTPRILAAGMVAALNPEAAWNILKKNKDVAAGWQLMESNSPLYMRLIENGMTESSGLRFSEVSTEENAQAKRTWIESIVKFLGNLTGKERGTRLADMLWQAREGANTYLFQRLGASLKAQAGVLEYTYELERQKDAIAQGLTNPDLIAHQVAEKLNDDFGGRNLRRGAQLLSGRARKAETEALGRLSFLAMDWTESNLNTMLKMFFKKDIRFENDKQKQAYLDRQSKRMYRHLFMQAVLRSQVATVAFNALMAGLDDEEDVVSMYQKAWESGNFNWLKADVTSLANVMDRALGKSSPHHPDSRVYFSIIGHFLDMPKYAVKMTKDPFAVVKGKASPLMAGAANLVTMTDWKRMPYTPLINADNEEKSLLKVSSDEGIEFGVTKAWGADRERPSKWAQMPSFLIDTMQAQLPIFAQSGIETLEGQASWFDFTGDAVGLHMTRTYPDRDSKVRNRAQRLEGGR